MKYHILFYISLFALSFGLVSCSSDKSSKEDTAFDFNLRVFSHEQDTQQLSSFGNSNLALNDYVTLYNGIDLFPSWSLADVKQYQLTGLKTTSTYVTCYDSQNKKTIKESSFSSSSFKVFEVLPELALLNDESSVSCEFIVKGTHKSGASQTIVKMVDILLDASKDFRIFPALTAPKVYIAKTQFIKHLQDRNLLQTDRLDLICKEKEGQLQTLQLVSESTQQLQSLNLSMDQLANVSTCKMISFYQGNKYLSETVTLLATDVTSTHIFYSPVNVLSNRQPPVRGRTLGRVDGTLFYTFRITNHSSKVYELFIDPRAIETTVNDCIKSKCKTHAVDEQIEFSKPVLAVNHVQLMPRESIEVYIHVSQLQRVLGDFMGRIDYDAYKFHGRKTQVLLNLKEDAFRIKEESDSPYTTILPVHLNPGLITR